METSQQKKRFSESELAQQLQRILTLPFIALIRAYQWCISPFLGPHCRFEPSCSHYAVEAFKVHGLARGAFLAINRIRKCHPWHCGGCDPVPAKKPLTTKSETET